jgi:hypothetical protein
MMVTAWAGAWIACSSFDDAPATEVADAASTTDGTTSPPDAEGDADPSVGADAACDAFFCDGFERGNGVATAWDQAPPPKGAELTLSKLHPRTGTGSLRLALTPDAGTRTASLSKLLPAGATSTTLDCWIYYDQSPSTDTTLASVHLRTLDGNIYVLLGKGGVFHLGEQYALDGGPTVTAPGVDVGGIRTGPVHLTLEIGPSLFDAGPGARLSVDESSESIQLVNSQPNPAKINVGSTYSAPGAQGADTFFYDDVVIEAKPR